jgi:hypothetical protein
MEPMTYGEVVADRIREARRAAEQERKLARQSLHSTSVIPSWRIASGRLLVSLGERIAGCAELARGEIQGSAQNVRLAG